MAARGVNRICVCVFRYQTDSNVGPPSVTLLQH